MLRAVVLVLGVLELKSYKKKLDTLGGRCYK